jgi:phosphoribosylamine--glycine ligase
VRYLRLLVIGNGGREHALVWKLHQNKSIAKIYCAPGNGGTAELAENINIKTTDISSLLRFAKENKINLTVVGPELPLVSGIVDVFKKNNLRIFGPEKKAARLEGSKVFAKNLMKKYNIPTAKFSVFENPADAISFIKNNSWARIVKADGIASGKGVYVCKNEGDAIKAVQEIMDEKKFGAAGNKVLIEEKLEGEEISFLAFSDGKTILPLLPSQDHKAIYDNDLGPNTGGMGAYAPLPLVDSVLQKEIMSTVMIPTIIATQKEGFSYKGVLYAGLMLTSKGIKVLEYNCRFGDPETQPLLALLETDLVDIMNACIDSKLEKLKISFRDGYACCVIMSSKGYPGEYEKGKLIEGIDLTKQINNLAVFHSGTKIEAGKVYTNAGRILGVTGTGKNIKEAIDTAYRGVESIFFEGCHYRKDIGRKALVKLK